MEERPAQTHRRTHATNQPSLLSHTYILTAQSALSHSIDAAAWGTGPSADAKDAKDAMKRDQYGRTGTGACPSIALSHETHWLGLAWLVVPVTWSCQSPTWIRLVNYLHLHLHVHMAKLPPLPSHFSTRLQSLRPRLEQSPRKFLWRTRCATFRCCVAASQGRSSPRHLHQGPGSRWAAYSDR